MLRFIFCVLAFALFSSSSAHAQLFRRARTVKPSSCQNCRQTTTIKTSPSYQNRPQVSNQAPAQIHFQQPVSAQPLVHIPAQQQAPVSFYDAQQTAFFVPSANSTFAPVTTPQPVEYSEPVLTAIPSTTDFPISSESQLLPIQGSVIEQGISFSESTHSNPPSVPLENAEISVAASNLPVSVSSENELTLNPAQEDLQTSDTQTQTKSVLTLTEPEPTPAAVTDDDTPSTSEPEATAPTEVKEATPAPTTTESTDSPIQPALELGALPLQMHVD